MVRRGLLTVGSSLLLFAACSSDRDAGPIRQPGKVTSTSTAGTAISGGTGSTASGSAPAEGTHGSAPTATGATAETSSTVATAQITVLAVAGSAGEVEPAGPPYALTNLFSEAVRLANGTCVGWADSPAGSTAGLAVGAPVTVLDAVLNQEIGTGSVTASRWEDPSGGGNQWQCVFEITATVTGTPAEVRVKVGSLEIWTARPLAATPGTFVASVSSDASIGLIASCPAVPTEPDPTTSAPSSSSTTVAPAPTAAPVLVSGWNAVGQYWARGVAALCEAGLPVIAIARPCRPPTAGSDYITGVVDATDPTASYANGAGVPAGTQLTVIVATGRPC